MDFSVPRAAAASVVLRAEEDLTLAHEPGVAPASITHLPDGSSEIKASIGAQGAVRLAFRPRVTATEAASETRLSVDQDWRVDVSLGAASLEASLKVSVLAGAAKSLEMQLPSTMRLLSVSGPFVRDWSNPGADGILRALESLDA